MSILKKFFWILILLPVMLFGCSSNSAEKRFQEYAEAWKAFNYEKMYDMLSTETKARIKKEDFISKNKARYDLVLDGNNKNIEVSPSKDKKATKDEKGQYKIPFDFKMNTIAGAVEFSHEAVMVKEKGEKGNDWYINWDQSMFYPKMAEGDGIKSFPTEEGLRGDIMDCNGEKLATYTDGILVELIKNKFDKSNVEKVSKALSIKPEMITGYLNEKNARTHVSLVILSKQEYSNKYDELNSIKSGLAFSNKKVRYYPYGEAAMHLTGYINSNKDGVQGFEKQYNERLKGSGGVQIVIVDSQNNKKDVIAEKPASRGKDIILTVNMKLQQKLYEELKSNTGSAAAINPATGEVLGLVSTPSVDPNRFTFGRMTDEEYKAAEARGAFKAGYMFSEVPGSVFKPITAAIGVDKNKFDPNEKLKIQGPIWDNNGAWNPPVKRVEPNKDDVDLKTALIYSDNIYFARRALDIKIDTFTEGTKAFGIGEEIPDFPNAYVSQISGPDGITSLRKLADTAYGQGDVRITPLQMAYLYTPFVNSGNLIKPVIEKDNSKTLPEMWKQSIIKPETAQLIKGMLESVVNTPETRTYREARVNNKTIAGKTGTPEITNNGKDIDGWFVGFNTDNPELLIVMMVKDPDYNLGSHTVVPKVQRVMDWYFNKK